MDSIENNGLAMDVARMPHSVRDIDRTRNASLYRDLRHVNRATGGFFCHTCRQHPKVSFA